MMHFTLALNLLAVVFASATASRCPAGSVQGLSPEDCYAYADEEVGWFQAEEKCQERGGHLASIPNGFVNGFMLELPNFSVTSRYWTGGSTGLSSAYSWSWIDGTAFEYTNWAKGE